VPACFPEDRYQQVARPIHRRRLPGRPRCAVDQPVDAHQLRYLVERIQHCEQGGEALEGARSRGILALSHA